MEAQKQSYPTDLTDSQWELVKDFLPTAGTRGRKRTVDLRAVLNAIFYINVGGNAWRMLPHDFPKWQTVYCYFRLWRVKKIWQEINEKFQQRYRVVVLTAEIAFLLLFLLLWLFLSHLSYLDSTLSCFHRHLSPLGKSS
jgi:transposase